jgi:hypothetical protein
LYNSPCSPSEKPESIQITIVPSDVSVSGDTAVRTTFEPEQGNEGELGAFDLITQASEDERGSSPSAELAVVERYKWISSERRSN